MPECWSTGVLEYWSFGVLEDRYSNTPVLQCSNAPTLQCSNTPMLQHSSTPTLHYSCTPILMNIYMIAGESSGDAHGAVLMREIARLVPDARFYGAGGPQMREIAGKEFLDWTQEAVVGLWDVIVKYPYFREKFYR